MQIIRCSLILHDSLFYATREMGTLYETGRYLHNYALSYALFSERWIGVPYFAKGYLPTYAEDLNKLNERLVYVTPARPLKWDYLLVTWKMAQVNYYRKPERFGGKGNYPENFGRAKELTPESEFEFFIITKEQIQLPRWIRLGKWASKAQVIPDLPITVDKRKGSFVSKIPLNPLDLSGKLGPFDLISMPPVSLVVNAHLESEYYYLPYGVKIPAEMKYTFRI